MKKIDLGQTIAILANVGVIAGIVFLGFELRQNQLVGRAHSRNELSRAKEELTMVDLSNSIERILRVRSGDEFSEEERVTLNGWASLWLNFFENVHYQYRMRLLDEDEFEAEMRELRRGLNGRGPMKSAFCSRRDRLSPSFVVEVESRLEAPCV